jgi:hypothetical protein
VKTIWDKLQEIDPRYIYAALLVFVVVPMLFPVSLPNIPSPPAEQAYKTIETVANDNPGGFVLIASDWAASTRGESHWQDLAVLRQIMSHHLRFAEVSFDPQNRSLEQADIATINDELVQTHPGFARYVYGRDYCLWGYRPSTAIPQFLKGLVDNVPETVHSDYKGNLISNLPCMHGINSLKDADAIELITPSSLLDTFLQFVDTKTGGTPLIYLPTSVMAPEGYPYLDSGQISGMVTGIKGAGDYEQLEGAHGFATRISTALSLVYFLILLLILIGNVSYYVGRNIKLRGGAGS